MAPADNSHTMSPTAATGRILGVERTPDGLDIIVEANDEAARVLSGDPSVGVSARIVEDYTRADGKSWGAALQHALITYMPRITGMRPWQPVDCADETDELLDLSALTFTPDGDIKQEETSAVSGEETPQKELVDMPPIPADQQEALKALFKQWQDEEAKADAPSPQVAPQSAEFKEQETKAEDKADEVVEELEPIAASDDESKSVDLAQVELATKLDKAAIELAELRAERDAERWENESQSLVRDYGITPAIVKLAEPLLKGSKRTVELSDGSSVDAGEIVRGVLHTVAKTYGKAVDLSGPVGTVHEVAASNAEQEERDAFLTAQRSNGFAR
jgi:hypothetical protein